MPPPTPGPSPGAQRPLLCPISPTSETLRPRGVRLGLGGPSHLQAPAQTDLPTFLPVDIISSGQSQPKLYSQPPVSPGKNSSPRGPGPEIQECYCIHSRTYTHTHTPHSHTDSPQALSGIPLQDGGTDKNGRKRPRKDEEHSHLLSIYGALQPA